MLVQGGCVSPGNYLNYAGRNGYYWSSVDRTSSIAYNLYFNSGNVLPSNHSYRYVGYSVRCVALGG